MRPYFTADCGGPLLEGTVALEVQSIALRQDVRRAPRGENPLRRLRDWPYAGISAADRRQSATDEVAGAMAGVLPAESTGASSSSMPPRFAIATPTRTSTMPCIASGRPVNVSLPAWPPSWRRWRARPIQAWPQADRPRGSPLMVLQNSGMDRGARIDYADSFKHSPLQAAGNRRIRQQLTLTIDLYPPRVEPKQTLAIGGGLFHNQP